MTMLRPSSVTEEGRARLRKLDAIGWGVFLIWIGVAFLAKVGWGAGLLGIAVIALAGQLARRYHELPVDRFALAVAIVFAFWGTLELLNVRVEDTSIPAAAFPILFIVVGLAIVVSALRKRRQ